MKVAQLLRISSQLPDFDRMKHRQRSDTHMGSLNLELGQNKPHLLANSKADQPASVNGRARSSERYETGTRKPCSQPCLLLMLASRVTG